MIKIFLVAIVIVCLGCGYMNELDGPGGYSSISLTSLSSVLKCGTQASHHFPSILQVTNPEIDSGVIYVIFSTSNLVSNWC